MWLPILSGNSLWLRRLLLLSALALGILFLFLLLLLPSRASGSTKSRPALMAPLSAIKRVLLHVGFSRSMGVIMRRPLLLLPIGPLSIRLLLLLLFADAPSRSLMCRMLFFMASCMRRSTCILPLETLFLMVTSSF